MEPFGDEPLVLGPSSSRRSSGSQGACWSHPVAVVVCCASLGLLAGWGLSSWQPADPAAKRSAVRWVGLVGDLFLRGLRCVVLPLVFVSVTLSVADMLARGKAGEVVRRTILLYLTTTVAAASIGVGTALVFSRLFLPSHAPGATAGDAELANLSLSDTLYEGVFLKLVSSNLTADFAASNFASLIVFAVALGFGLHHAAERGGGGSGGGGGGGGSQRWRRPRARRRRPCTR